MTAAFCLFWSYIARPSLVACELFLERADDTFCIAKLILHSIQSLRNPDDNVLKYER